LKAQNLNKSEKIIVLAQNMEFTVFESHPHRKHHKMSGWLPDCRKMVFGGSFSGSGSKTVNHKFCALTSKTLLSFRFS
jgi:hypothetical protein